MVEPVGPLALTEDQNGGVRHIGGNQLEQHLLGRVLQRRQPIVDDEHVGRVNQSAGHGKTLAFAGAEDLVPAILLGQAVGQVMQADAGQNLDQAVVAGRLLAERVEERAAQSAHGHVGLLRHDHRGEAAGLLDPAASPGPKAGDDADERCLART